MGWWWKKRPKPLEFVLEDIEYLCEQDGPPERELKRALSGVLDRATSVRAAYLLRVRIPDPGGESVLLGLVAGEVDQTGLLKAIGEVVRLHVPRDVWMDIAFMTPEEADRAAEVAGPFYSA